MSVCLIRRGFDVLPGELERYQSAPVLHASSRLSLEISRDNHYSRFQRMLPNRHEDPLETKTSPCHGEPNYLKLHMSIVERESLASGSDSIPINYRKLINQCEPNDFMLHMPIVERESLASGSDSIPINYRKLINQCEKNENYEHLMKFHYYRTGGKNRSWKDMLDSKTSQMHQRIHM
jgi:hypothetical protein